MAKRAKRRVRSGRKGQQPQLDPAVTSDAGVAGENTAVEAIAPAMEPLCATVAVAGTDEQEQEQEHVYEGGVAVGALPEDGDVAVPTPQPPEHALHNELVTRLTALAAMPEFVEDDGGLSHVRRLCERAVSCGSGDKPNRYLLERAARYLEGLLDGAERRRRRAEAQAERLTQLGRVGALRATQLQNEGRYLELSRLCRRYPERSPRLRDRLLSEWRAALDAEAELRGLTSPGMIDAPSDEELEQAETMDLALQLYRDTASATHAALSIARAVDALPSQAGHYHAGTVATRALQSMQSVPPYLKAQLNRIEVLRLLERYGAATLPEAEPVPARRPKRAANKNRSTKGTTTQRPTKASATAS